MIGLSPVMWVALISQLVTLLCKQTAVPQAHATDVNKSSSLQTTNILHKEVNLPLWLKLIVQLHYISLV